jgi:hypothetical protein
LDEVGEATENAVEDTNDLHIRLKEPHLGHVNRSQDAHLIEQSVDYYPLNCVQVEVNREFCSVREVS